MTDSDDEMVSDLGDLTMKEPPVKKDKFVDIGSETVGSIFDTS